MPRIDNKRVAKNAVALTVRMVLVTFVGLFTSRIVLGALGVEDYGIYGVIGGVVGMASFLNTSMAGATSRFITFELGREDLTKLKNIFSTALFIHLGIAIFVLILAETIGLWFLNHKMVIPPNRMEAANLLYQFSIISMVVSFTQVPYAADIIAHEKMDIYAYFEIINVVLKLVIVYLLLIIPSDRLIFYAGLSLFVTILNALFYRWYCVKHFQEAHLSSKFDKATAKEMASFSAYDLYGNMCLVAKTQGEPIILNMFFGVVANAAASIAMTVTGAISGFTTTISQAFRPQMIKQYAVGDIEQMRSIMRRSIQFSTLAYAILAIPFMLETPRILYIWLGQVPPYSVVFLRLIAIALFFNVIVGPNNAAIQATGKIKKLSFFSGTLYIISLITSYILFKIFHYGASTLYIVNALMYLLFVLIGLGLLRLQIPNFKIFDYSLSIGRSIVAIAASLIVVSYAKYLYDAISITPKQVDIWHSILYCFMIFAIGGVVTFGISYFIAFNSDDRSVIRSKAKNYMEHILSKIAP